jgi:hypothetical protein
MGVAFFRRVQRHNAQVAAQKPPAPAPEQTPAVPSVPHSEPQTHQQQQGPAKRR